MAELRVLNPATEEVLAVLRSASPEEAREAVQHARAAQPAWAALGAEERAGFVEAFADALAGRRHEAAETVTREMGKPITEALAEVDKGVSSARMLAQHAPAWLAEERVDLGAGKVGVARAEPAGVVGVITPWNFPVWQVLRSALPAMLAGNAVVAKPAEEAPLSPLLLRRCFEEAGLPRGALRMLVGGPEAGAALVEAPVDVVAFTGSVAGGRSVAQAAAPAFKRVVLEMGGSDPFLVLGDAELRAAVRMAVQGRFANAGQICINSKRFFVHESLFEEFVAGFVEGAEALRVGDPLEPTTEMGPLVRVDQREALHRQVRASAAAGARVKTGGQPLERKGFYYAPTVMDLVQPAMPVMCEETFGPVGPVMPFRDLEQAIALANASDFGLGASVFTRDAARAQDVARRLQVGVVAVNDIVHSHPLLPFGGVKHSGLGRELSRHGILEFCRFKSVTA